MQVRPEDLFTKIGILTVELDVTRADLEKVTQERDDLIKVVKDKAPKTEPTPEPGTDA